MTAVFRMRSRNIDSAVGAFKRLGTVAAMAIVGGVLVQCTSAPPTPPAASPPPPATRSSPSAPTSTPPPPPPLAPADRSPGHRRRARRELAAGLPHRAAAAAAGRGQLPRLRRPDPPRRTDRARRPGRRCRSRSSSELHQLGYPIEKMRTVDHYPAADDELSMEDNNTSAFNCRDIPGTGRWSRARLRSGHRRQPATQPVHRQHGRLPTQNAAPYLDRNRIDPGLLHDGDPAVRAFTDRGWRWGGYWRTPKDYQHFERR